MIKRFDECDRMSQIIVFDKYFKTAGQVAFEPLAEILKNKPKKHLQNLMLCLKK